MAPRNIGIVGGIIVAVIAIIAIVQVTWANGIFMMFRGSPAMVLFIVSALVVAAAVVTYRLGGPFIPVAVAAVLVFFLFIFVIFYSGYGQAKRVNEVNSTLSADNGVAQMPTYKVRAPFTIAEQQTNDNITINGQAQNTTHIPALDKYGAPVVRSGLFKGYGQVVSQSIGESGQSELEYCDFAAQASARLGGTFSHNLERRIMRENFGVLIDSSDAYAYCNDKEQPIVVVPLKAYDGLLFPIEVPAGVGVYNGATDELVVQDSVDANTIPGPVYPLSLAEQARSATKASNGWWNYLQSNTGYQEYGGDNSGDYTLRLADESGDSFVTPLTPIGGGKAITAVGYVDSNAFKAGKLNAYNIAVLPKSRQGDSAVADRVVNDYSELNWASGLKVFEITPTGPDKWTATIGLGKAVSFRLTINPDASSCLYSLDGERVRCTGETVGTPDGTTDDGAGEPNLTGDVATMTDEELVAFDRQLADLDSQVRDELARRLTATGAATE